MNKYLQIYVRGGPRTLIENPSNIQLGEHIDRLDGEIHTNLVLLSDIGNLFIYSSKNGRLHVAYSGIGPVNAYLLDTSQPNTQMLEFPLENGGVDDWSMRETVSPDMAKKVAAYFLQNNRFPEGIDWEGNMNDFDKLSSDG